MKNLKDLWSNNVVQFTRLLAELYALGLPQVIREAEWSALEASMDLDRDKIMSIFHRAESAFELLKKQGFTDEILMKWGETEPFEDRPVSHHTFTSIEELNAFCEGVNEADGWLSGAEVEECPHHPETYFYADEICPKCNEEEGGE